MKNATLPAPNEVSMKTVDHSKVIGTFLDNAGEEYLESINDIRPESLISMIDRIEPALHYISKRNLFVSIGIGQGEEIQALHHLFSDYGSKIVGVDISEVAIHKTSKRLRHNNIDVSLVKANATALPFEQNQVDAIFASSVLHEIYSYHPEGLEAWKKSLHEISRTLVPGGVAFIRDFAAPDIEGNVVCILRSELARHFYTFFREKYRMFLSSTWNEEGTQAMHADNEFVFPVLHETESAVTIPLHSAGELMLHFRNFWSDLQRGGVSFESSTWKEADEMYYLTHNALNPTQYIQLLIQSLNESLSEKEEVHLLSKKLVDRPQTNKFLSTHFGLKLCGNEVHYSSDDLIAQTTRKLECIVAKACV